ncbi:MAG: CRISPR system precrRNA processing endoribonuclease RAMP protein Cas6 [Candidatus Binatia bacterium]
MQFGGLLGSVTYEGEVSSFMPRLALGEWLHVSGKTSIGSGKYRMLLEKVTARDDQLRIPSKTGEE